ncbi:hypothetical protein MNAN1_003979 [Malassezia nana]|uniref:Uncharacterized protein n=1 Tax=Malassezia nana TaxID=180528 RepID=A0AAF0EQ29_9BASI|nr:hypothetical protein MNAN1_003979 [Malassezia nana]
MALRLSARAATLYPRARTFLLPTYTLRTLRTSAVQWASEDPRSSWEQTLPPGFEKLGESPEALAAVNHLIEVLEKHGLDLSSGTKPSMMQMAKLATNAEVRECTAKVVQEMKKAGVDLSPENLQKIMNGSFRPCSMDGSLPAPASGFRYAMGVMRLHPHLDELARTLGSAEAAPALRDMQSALQHWNMGEPLALLRRPVPVYLTEPTMGRKLDMESNMRTFLIVLGVVVTTLSLLVAERVLRTRL